MKFHETIIEVYDDEQINNVLSISEFSPKNAVYLGTRKVKNKKLKNSIITYLKDSKLDTKCFFYSTDMMSIESIIAELENIHQIFGDIAIDLTGGSEVALVAIGMFATRRNVPLFSYDKHSRKYRNVYNCPSVEGKALTLSTNVRSVLTLHGGAMKSHGHISLDRLSKEIEDDIFKVWDIYTAHQKGWNRTVSYLQQVSKNLSAQDLNVLAKGIVFGEERIAEADREIMKALSNEGIIENYQVLPRNTSFKYKNRLIKSCLTDIGICLELYVYATAIKSGLFDDVQISVVIDWDGKLDDVINTINEIDVIITKGIVPMFISCKSGFPSVTALNEIKMLTKQFGGGLAKPVLVTMSDVESKDKYLYKRAEDMGVEIIGREELLAGNLINRLLSVYKS